MERGLENLFREPQFLTEREELEILRRERRDAKIVGYTLLGLLVFLWVMRR